MNSTDMPPTTRQHLRAYILPVSGGRFAVQIGMISAISGAYDLIRARKPGQIHSRVERPDLIFASSGGNVVAYTALAADWSRDRLVSICDLIDSNAFLDTEGVTAPHWTAFPLSKGFYRRGYGLKNVFNVMFPPGKLGDIDTPEIWTGVMHVPTRSHRLVCNKRIGETLIAPVNIMDPNSLDNLHLGTNIHPIYAGGDRDLLADITLASASIPVIVEPMSIFGDEYRDGGCMYASPMTVLQNELYAATLDGSAVTRLVYFSPVTLATSRAGKSSLLNAIDDLIYSTRTIDIRAFINTVTRLGGAYTSPSIKRRMNMKELSNLFEVLDESNSHYAVLLYPDLPLDEFKRDPSPLSLDLTNLQPVKIRRVVERVEQYIGAYVWDTPRSTGSIQ